MEKGGYLLHRVPKTYPRRSVMLERLPMIVQPAALRYRCQVECPNTGTTTANPRNNGMLAKTSRPTTINPQSAMASGFLAITRKEVRIASVADARRSMRTGKEPTLIANTTIAKVNPATHHST